MRYTLDDGEERHCEKPETFSIPSTADRSTLEPGQLVKLIFRIEIGDEVNVERMWVKVTGRNEKGYLGALDNQPHCTEELRAGDTVRFEAKHVIDIYESQPDA